MDVSTRENKTRRDYNLKFHRVEGCTAWSCAASCRGNELPTVAAGGGGGSDGDDNSNGGGGGNCSSSSSSSSSGRASTRARVSRDKEE
ncbi:hypothetical protein HZH66_004663 [Vespula vulgaris]|uniref:Uncharacterized protein n=1 Tax=Vespula vulgaris TaxID=7454 RepID=A0A834K940_VESVU|nr:hypothetical protein HZH66_004663 [Vespula vulgaris]